MLGGSRGRRAYSRGLADAPEAIIVNRSTGWNGRVTVGCERGGRPRRTIAVKPRGVKNSDSATEMTQAWNTVVGSGDSVLNPRELGPRDLFAGNSIACAGASERASGC